MPKLASLLASFALAALATQAIAQQPPTPTVRIRGTIEAVDGPMLSIKSREGTDMKVKMTDNVVVFAVVKTELSEIKPNSYIGVTAMPEPDGTQRAIGRPHGELYSMTAWPLPRLVMPRAVKSPLPASMRRLPMFLR